MDKRAPRVANLKESLSIVGGGLTGCTLAYLLKNRYEITIYEREKIGGICRDNDNYQDYIHVLHTDNDEVWDWVSSLTTIRPHRTKLQSFWDDKLHPYPPKELTDEIIEKQYLPYSRKMWGGEAPVEAKDRWKTSKDGYIFHNKHEGIPDFTRLFNNLTDGINIVYKKIKVGDLTGPIILTGAIDEYYNYYFGELPYRGMGSVHFPSDIRLSADFITFPDERIPFLRLVDYSRLGYGNFIGIEYPSNDKLYPVRNKETEKIYDKYVEMAKEDGVQLCGRAARFTYRNMDECIEMAFGLAEELLGEVDG